VYRDPRESLVRTIEQLRAELDELRALRPRRRWRSPLLFVLTIASALVAVYAIAACAAARARADDYERKYDGVRVRFEAKTRDLGTCESLALQTLGRD
jgi:hypothetical protein